VVVQFRIDGDFWIDHDPKITGLVVAAGGSGHGFKFGKNEFFSHFEELKEDDGDIML
jgi:hypothetical protein